MSFLDTISIVDCDDQYDQLVKRISFLVYLTQDGKEQPLPEKLIMTKKQQKMLRRYPQMKAMYGTTQKYWLTPYNVMEVTVKEPAKELA